MECDGNMGVLWRVWVCWNEGVLGIGIVRGICDGGLCEMNEVWGDADNKVAIVGF